MELKEQDAYTLMSTFRLADTRTQAEFMMFIMANYKDMVDYFGMAVNERRMVTHGKGKYGEQFNDTSL